MPGDKRPGDAAFLVSFALRAEAGSDTSTYDGGGLTRTDDFDSEGPAWGDGYTEADADEFESRIDDVAVFLVDASDASVVKGSVTVGPVAAETESDGSVIYRFSGILSTTLTDSELAKNNTYSIVALANMPDSETPGQLGFARLGLPSASFTSIPMWGKAPAQLGGIERGKVHDLGEISLLRSMAKVRVSVSEDLQKDEAKNVTLTSLSVSNCYGEGIAAPGEWKTVSETGKVLLHNANVPSGSAVREFGVQSESGTTALWFYTPEYDNQADREFLIKVGYKVADEEREGEIHLCKYADGKPLAPARLWPVVRNHIYSYEITGVGESEDDLRFKVDIKDMTIGGSYVFDY